MSDYLDTTALRIVQQDKLLELKAQQQNLEQLKAELDRINEKLLKKEPLSKEDTKFMGNLGWLTALSVTIASIAASI
jgi:cell shape-determining protein MreC